MPKAPAVAHAPAPPAPSAPPSDLSLILQAARDPAVDAPKVQALLAELERREDRTARRAFNAAMAAAKAEIGPIFKTRLVNYPHKDDRGRTKYLHEDLAEVARIVDPVIGNLGLSYRFRIKQKPGNVSVTCIISHADGHFEDAAELDGPEDKSGQKNPLQAIGSAVTYLQRYTLKAAFGLAASERDDDGRGADDPVIDVDQVVYVEQLLRETESDLAKFLEYVGAPEIAQMTTSQFKIGVGLLETKKSRRTEGATA
jgi:hypothetical protein